MKLDKNQQKQLIKAIYIYLQIEEDIKQKQIPFIV